MSQRRRLGHSSQAIWFATAALGALAACGSGGTGEGVLTDPVVPPVSPPTAPPPAPPPPPPPAVSALEISNQPGLSQVNAIPAFDAEVLGEGVTIAVIDTGIDVDNPEFVGRISSLSADLTTDIRETLSVQDTQGHGTSVAGIAAGAANDLGTVGVAPEAEILAIRANFEDDPNTLDEDEALIIQGSAILAGFELAADAGASVVNLSLASNDPEAAEDFADIIGFFAASNDIVTVLAAGNSAPATDPEFSAQSAIAPVVAGTALVVGAVDADNTLSAFSNPAGITQDFFVVAPGSVPTPAIGGGITQFTGTSASVPHVSGAVALIRGLWPQLSAAETVQVILDSATDLGAPGVDPIFGQGLLNIGAALEPSGELTITSASGATLSPNALANSLASTFPASTSNPTSVVGFDDFGRDFEVSLTSVSVPPAAQRFQVSRSVSPFQQSKSARETLPGGGTLLLRLGERDLQTDPVRSLYFRDFSADEARDAAVRTFSVSFTQAFGKTSQFRFAQGFSARRIDGQLAGQTYANTLSRNTFSDAFLPETVDSTTGFTAFPGALGGRFDILVNVASDRLSQPDAFIIDGEPDNGEAVVAQRQTVRLGYSRVVGTGAFRFEAGLQAEDGTLLGQRLSETLFGQEQAARTLYTALSGRVRLAGGVTLNGRYSTGFSAVPQAASSSDFVTRADRLRSSQFSIGVDRPGLFNETDRLTLSLSQSLQIRKGQATLLLPTDFDPVTGETLFSEIEAAFGRQERPLDLEFGYSVRNFAGFDVALNTAYGLTGFGGGQVAFTFRARQIF